MHERKLMRLAGYNYSNSGYYFFTICVKDHLPSFGTIEERIMHFSDNGIISLEQWQWLGNQYPYIDLISFIVMPDHVHGIIYINADYFNNDVGNGNNDIGNCKNDVGNCRDRSLQSLQTNSISINTKIKPLPELIGAYKTTVSKRIHLIGDIDFKWQKSFHNHIITNTRALKRIKNYVEKNPGKWADTHFIN